MRGVGGQSGGFGGPTVGFRETFSVGLDSADHSSVVGFGGDSVRMGIVHRTMRDGIGFFCHDVICVWFECHQQRERC